MLKNALKKTILTLSLTAVAISCLSSPPPERNWSQSWNDEFNSLDTSKWYVEPNAKRGEHWWYANNVYVENGKMVIAVRSQDGRYTAGGVKTSKTWNNKLFEQKFGYFEARMKVSNQPGHWSAFWLMPKDIHHVDNSGRDGCEIDVVERPDKGRNTVQHNLHMDGYGIDHQVFGGELSVPNVDDGQYHTYGLWWTTSKYSFYVDGIKTWEITDPKWISQVKEYLFLSTEIGTWGGDIAQAQLPFYTYIDFVRVYTDLGASGAAAAPSFSYGTDFIQNGNFESGTTGWSCPSSMSTVSSPVHAGSKALKIYNRSAFWNAATQDLLSQVKSEGAGSYEIKAYLKDPVGGKTKSMAQVEYVDNGTTIRTSVSMRSLSDDWCEIKGVVAIPYSNLTSCKLLLRPENKEMNDYFVDQVSMKKIKGGSGSTPPPPSGSDSLTSISAPASVNQTGNYTVDVNYSATESRDIIVDFQSTENWAWYGGNRIRVSAGSGHIEVPVEIKNNPATGHAYRFAAKIIPAGGSWTEAFDSLTVDPVTVTASGGTTDEITSISGPSRVNQSGTYTVTVNYSATDNRDIKVDLQRTSDNAWFGGGKATVSAGSGSVDISIIVRNNPAKGSGYRFISILTSVGGNWGSRFDDAEINPVTVQ